ncbi:MAG: hypothetical protein MI919_02070, partial [Holophagales bacterium]|nr:hypothetical protein [Holophagales bacterium]
ELELSAAIEETITVTTESPLLDRRKISQGIQVTALELEKIPTARDPWAVAGQTPGVLMDRINVGGNESGQQPNFIGSGSNASQNKFMVDGVDITDMSATGSSATYFGFEQFEEMSFTTGGTDVTIQTPGVQLNMVTKRGTDEWRGSGSYNVTDESLQSSGNLDTGDLGSGQDAAGESLTGNQIDRITQYGVELGGFLWKEKIWLWGSYDENDIRQSVFGGSNDDTLLENWAVKANAQITDSNSFVYTYNRGEKLKFGRDAGPNRPPETTWNQGGPSPLQKVEDTHVFSSSFFLTASWSDMQGGFFLEPNGGRDATMWQDNDGVWHGSYFFLDNERPSERLQVDGSVFFNTGSISHELKLGANMRDAEQSEIFGVPGNGLYTIGLGGSSILGVAFRDRVTNTQVESRALWAQDTFTTDRLTINLGLRYDMQEGKNGASSAGAQGYAPDLLPGLDFGGNDPDFELTNLVPRLGLTYALGEESRTLLRASYSQFADQLGTSLVAEVNPLGNSLAQFLGTDLNSNGILDPDEPATRIAVSGFNPADPTALSSPNQIDPDIEAVVTEEIILGVEHSFLPELVGGFSVTWRQADDYYDSIGLYTDAAGNLVQLQAVDYVLEQTLTGNLPDGTAFSVPVYSVRPDLTDTGGALYTNTDRSTEYLGYTLSATKRLSNRWMMRAHVTLYDWEWSIGDEFRQFDDPTDGYNDNGDFHEWFADNDGAIFAEESGGSGNVSLFLNSRWSFNISGLYQLPWGFNISGNINGREGYPLPWYWDQLATNDGSKNVQVATVGRDRVDDIITTDLRIDKDFQIGDLGVTVAADVFNLFNEGYVIQRAVDVGSGRAGFVDQIIGPRVVRLGVRLAWN